MRGRKDRKVGVRGRYTIGARERESERLSCKSLQRLRVWVSGDARGRVPLGVVVDVEERPARSVGVTLACVTSHSHFAEITLSSFGMSLFPAPRARGSSVAFASPQSSLRSHLCSASRMPCVQLKSYFGHSNKTRLVPTRIRVPQLCKHHPPGGNPSCKRSW